MKTLKYLAVLALFAPLFLACTNTDAEEEMDLIQNSIDFVAGDDGGEVIPTPPPSPPPSPGK